MNADDLNLKEDIKKARVKLESVLADLDSGDILAYQRKNVLALEFIQDVLDEMEGFLAKGG